MEHLNRLVIKMSLLFTIVTLSSCYYDNEEELYPDYLNPCDTLPATYTNNVKAIIDANCATSGCHTGVAPTGGLFLDTYQQVSAIALNGDLSNRVIVQKNMPPSGPLSNCDMETLQNWINAGAPEN